MGKLLRNRAQCNNCGDVLESTHQHHFVACSCYEVSDKVIRQFQLNNVWELPKENWGGPTGCWTKEFYDLVKSRHGIAIDGGLAYSRGLFYNKNDLINLCEYEDENAN